MPKFFANDSEEILLAAKLKELMLLNNPKARVPDNLQKWAQEINKMIRIDKRTPKEIESVIIFSQKDSFWMTNILSAKALRKQFDRLYLQGKQKSALNGNLDAEDIPSYWKNDFTGKGSLPERECEENSPVVTEAINIALGKKDGG